MLQILIDIILQRITILTDIFIPTEGDLTFHFRSWKSYNRKLIADPLQVLLNVWQKKLMTVPSNRDTGTMEQQLTSFQWPKKSARVCSTNP